MDLCMPAFETLPMAKSQKPLPPPPPAQWNRLFIRERLDKKAGKTQAWLAKESGYSEPYISLLCGGRRPYNQKVEEDLEAALKVPRGALRHPPRKNEIREAVQSMDDDDRAELANALIDVLKRK